MVKYIVEIFYYHGDTEIVSYHEHFKGAFPSYLGLS